MKVHITSCSVINPIRQILVYFSKVNMLKVTANFNGMVAFQITKK